ncbi:hypothetical protein TcG_03284 [Trypanosoma cruzi]|nr:hypothetical protein TcG_03284 [Trypanosoma cruzi]
MIDAQAEMQHQALVSGSLHDTSVPHPAQSEAKWQGRQQCGHATLSSLVDGRRAYPPHRRHQFFFKHAFSRRGRQKLMMRARDPTHKRVVNGKTEKKRKYRRVTRIQKIQSKA